MMQLYYKLVGKEPVPMNNLMEWAASQTKNSNRIIKQITIGNTFVSTVFLGLDYNWGGGRPILFETMIFGGIYNQYQKRYCTYDEALEGHRAACIKATKGIKVQRYFNKDKSKLNQTLTFKNKRQWKNKQKTIQTDVNNSRK